MGKVKNPKQFGNVLDHEEELSNSDYEMTLENLIEDGDGESCTVEIPMSSGILNILRYREKEKGSFKNVDRKRNCKNDSNRVKAKVPEILGGFSRKAKTEMPKTVKKSWEIGNKGCKNKVRDVPSEERKTPVNENEINEEAEVDSVSCKSSESSKMLNYDTDESYAWLLDFLCKPGNNMEVSHESDDRSIQQTNDGSCSDLEIFAQDNIPFHEGDYTPFVPSKCYQSLPDEESLGGIRASSPSQFREKLMDLLKIPYNRQEFENLWREVTQRKPVEGVRHLRHGRMKPYPTKINGKSYLDRYEGLRMKIDEFGTDRHKILNLLRGFFFWLENTPHDGAFRPWLDSLYLNALGQPEILSEK